MKSHTARLFLVAGALALVLALAAVAPPVAPAQTPDDAVEEPVSSDTFLIAKGRVTYRVYCASCHGSKGLGDGTLAELLKVRPANLTQLSATNDGVYPRARVHATIDGRKEIKGHGNRDMPIWGEAFQKTLRATWKDVTDEERAELKVVEVVYFLESIQE